MLATKIDKNNISTPVGASAVLMLDDGSIFFGLGAGAQGSRTCEVCFNTAMSGYQEILTDPSYAHQAIVFSTAHVGNVGTNVYDSEAKMLGARACILRSPITNPSNWRSTKHFNQWLIDNDIVAISGIDTRALIVKIRNEGSPSAIICHNEAGKFDFEKLFNKLNDFKGLEGADLAIEVSCKKPYVFETQNKDSKIQPSTEKYNVVVIDYGVKYSILKKLKNLNCKVTVVPANYSAGRILALKPHGILLSNGPGDPEATGKYACAVITKLLEGDIPIFAICLGHQLLALSLGIKTEKMRFGHRGANHPIKDMDTNKVEIVSQNHGFVVVSNNLPKNVARTHYSLFDNTLAGIKIVDKDVFSVQYHPEASPGPQDSHYLFEKFIKNISKYINKSA